MPWSVYTNLVVYSVSTLFWAKRASDTGQEVMHWARSYNGQVSQSECLRVIGNFPRRTLIPSLHTTLNVTPIRLFIYHLTANFFDRCPAHPNPLVRSIGNYSLAYLRHQYKKYIHKRPKHIFF